MSQTSGLSLGSKIMSIDGRYIYHISIIDYLQDYNYKKFLETYGKWAFQNAPLNEVSSVHPKLYGDRFFNFMSCQVFTY